LADFFEGRILGLAEPPYAPAARQCDRSLRFSILGLAREKSPIIERGIGEQSMTARHCLSMIIACAALSTSPIASVAENFPATAKLERGRDIANMVCAVCHIIGPGQDGAPVLRNPGPDFRLIANRPGTTAEQLGTVLRARHPAAADAMPPPLLSDEMIDAVTAYILSLRTRH
jgi:mono/diheme cytochrome c family protein